MTSLGEGLVKKCSILPSLVSETPSAAFEELVAALGDTIVHPASFLKEIEARENLQTTDTGRGIAFPHARTISVEKISLAIGRSVKGIPFRSGGNPVHLIFLFGVPPLEVSLYLECVSWIARKVRNPEVYQLLLHAETAGAFYKALEIEVES